MARLSDTDQNDPKKVKEALKKEFDKVAPAQWTFYLIEKTRKALW